MQKELVANIQKEREEAFRNGIKFAYTKGYDDGFEKYRENLHKNYVEATQKGYDKGYSEICDEEYASGYESGNEDGMMCFYDLKKKIVVELNNIINSGSDDNSNISFKLKEFSKKLMSSINYSFGNYMHNLSDYTSDVINNPKYEKYIQVNYENDFDDHDLENDDHNDKICGKYVTEKQMWDKTKNFTDICELSSLWYQNKIKYMPHQFHHNDNNLNDFDNLPEIAEIIVKCNALGFFITDAQPGEIMKGTPDTAKFRAYVGGYIRKDNWLKLVKKLKDDSNIVVDINGFDKLNYYPNSDEINVLTRSLKFMSEDDPNSLISATFINGEFPTEIYNEKYENGTIDDDIDSDIQYFHRSLSCYDITLDEYIGHELDDSADIINVSLYDKEWGRNTYLWNLILEVLENKQN